MHNTLKLDLELDLDQLKESIESAHDLNDNQAVFNQLIEVYRAKKQVSDILDQLISLETEAKGWIKNKANSLYGHKWSAIQGNGYKITQQATGAVFNIIPDTKPAKKFLIVKEALDSKLVELHIKETGKLPKGIEYNPSRGSSIRVSVQDNVE